MNVGSRPSATPASGSTSAFTSSPSSSCIFDVEVVFLFPWATVYKDLGWFAFVEMLVFLGILFVGYAYVWRNGDLDWDRPAPKIPLYEQGVGVREPRLDEDEVTVG